MQKDWRVELKSKIYLKLKGYYEEGETYRSAEAYAQGDLNELETFIDSLLTTERQAVLNEVMALKRYDYDGNLVQCIMLKDVEFLTRKGELN